MTSILLTPTPFPNFFMDSVSATGFNLNASGIKYSIVFLAADALTISELCFGTFTGSGTQPTYKISLQGVDSAGLPDGTVKGGGSPASTTFSGASNTLLWVTLDNTYAASRNELLALVVEHSSGTVDGSNFSRFTPSYNFTGDRPSTPYSLTNNGTSWAKNTSTGPGIWGYSDGTDKHGNPFKTSTSSISSTVEAGARINLNSGYGDTYQISGCTFFRGSLPTSATLALSLYNSSLNLIQSGTVATDASANLSDARTTNMYFDETTLVDLAFGSDFYLIASVSSSSSNIKTLLLADALSIEAIPLGNDFVLASRSHTYPPANGGGAFTITSTTRPMMMPLIVDITEPTGGGGGGGSKLAGRGGGLAG